MRFQSNIKYVLNMFDYDDGCTAQGTSFLAYKILGAQALMSAPGGWTGACSGDSSIMLENPSNVSVFSLVLKFDKMYPV